MRLRNTIRLVLGNKMLKGRRSIKFKIALGKNPFFKKSNFLTTNIDQNFRKE